jgi:hypothetical protein
MKKAIILTTIILALFAVSATGCSSCADNPASGSGVESGASEESSAEESGAGASDQSQVSAKTWEGNERNPKMDFCTHINSESHSYFDDERMVIPEMWKFTTISSLLSSEQAFENHKFEVYQKGTLVTDWEKYFDTGMIVLIYHGDELYGEYQVEMTDYFKIMFRADGQPWGGEFVGKDYTIHLPTVCTIEHIINNTGLKEKGITASVKKNGIEIKSGFVEDGLKITLTDKFGDLIGEFTTIDTYELGRIR